MLSFVQIRGIQEQKWNYLLDDALREYLMLLSGVR